MTSTAFKKRFLHNLRGGSESINKECAAYAETVYLPGDSNDTTRAPLSTTFYEKEMQLRALKVHASVQNLWSLQDVVLGRKAAEAGRCLSVLAQIFNDQTEHDLGSTFSVRQRNRPFRDVHSLSHVHVLFPLHTKQINGFIDVVRTKEG